MADVFTALCRYQDSLSSMVLSEENIRKVVKYRVCSMAIHPSQSIVLVAAGDKSGQVGLWNVVSRPAQSPSGAVGAGWAQRPFFTFMVVFCTFPVFRDNTRVSETG